MNEAYVGILFNASTYRGIPRGKTQRESLSAYEEAAREFGLTPCFLQLKDIQANAPFTMAYVKTRTGYVRKRIPTPSVIHNRAMFFTAENNNQLRRLSKSGIQIFNQLTRYDKIYIHQLLMKNELLKPYLPETHLLNNTTLNAMMNKYDHLILKPNNSSLGRGLMKLSCRQDNWTATFPAKSQRSGFRSTALNIGHLPLAMRSVIKKESYLIQERIPLATYQQRPFDLRVSVQRNEYGEWQVTGMIARVAAGRKFVTNLARGGTSITMKQLFTHALPHTEQAEVLEHVRLLSLMIAKHLESLLPALADVGLDIGITEKGLPRFIELNGRDARYSFREAGLTGTWKNTFRNPIAYASHLLTAK